MGADKEPMGKEWKRFDFFIVAWIWMVSVMLFSSSTFCHQSKLFNVDMDNHEHIDSNDLQGDQ